MEPTQDERLPYAERIAKMLRLAERTENEHEAKAFTDKAQRLMVKYAVTEELLAQAEGRQVQDHVVEEKIVYTGIFHMALFNVGRAIAQANGCRHLITKGPGLKSTLHVIGFKSDVTNVHLLDASLQVQASIAMQRWYREQHTDGYTPMMKSKMRRTYLFGFASGLAAQLDEAKRAGVDEAVADEAARTGDADAARKSTELVLLSKKERVDDWVDNTYGKTLRTVKNNYSTTGWAASGAGYKAGKNADVGNPRLGASHREIGR